MRNSSKRCALLRDAEAGCVELSLAEPVRPCKGFSPEPQRAVARRSGVVGPPAPRALSFYAQGQAQPLARPSSRAHTHAAPPAYRRSDTLRRAPDPPRNTREPRAAARAARNKVQHQLPLTNSPGARP